MSEFKIIISRVLYHTHPTPSGKVYSRETLEKFVNDWKDNKRTLLGEFYEPQTVIFAHEIDLSRVSSIIVDMYVDDEGLVVHQQIVDTPYGKILNDLVVSDIPFSISAKVIGQLDRDNAVHNAKLCGIVYTPTETVTNSDKE